ncbi:hypothetical protein ESCO30_00105 [Escherichia phage vB_EcoS_ESCO30]|uniref:Uncharacterized protein n=1 Tax=Escherichia phage vB_EcoS_ESCO30 TaxID=2918879 RepID=A0AAE9HJ97_9CAUD|nr:hypothetical protein ESCO30_00105 [Escherichia phage vB_EcoS_ESCO30]
MTEEVAKSPETVASVAAELHRHEESDKKKWEKVKAYEEEHREHDDKDEEDDDDEHCHKYGKHKMQEPVNVFTNGFPGMGAFPANASAFGGEGMGLFGAILIGALLTGGFGGFGGFGRGVGVAAEGTAVDAILSNQDTASILAAINTTRTEANQGTGAVLSAVNGVGAAQAASTQQVLTTIYGTGANLSNQICAETRNVIQGQFDLSRQMDQSFAANQIARAQDKFDSAQIAFQQSIQTNNQFAAVQAQMCANQNAIERQLAECCCELQTAIAGVTTARIQDELNECRLREAIAAGSGANGQVINQIAVSLGAITQTLAGLQAKLPA